jgi:hypothetical protein
LARYGCVISPDSSGVQLDQFVSDVASKDAVIRTDGWTGYNGLCEQGYLHERTVLSSSGDPAHVAMPGVHRVASLLKRWILGTHQGSVVPEHLQSYIEEFTFRFNRRTSKSRGLVIAQGPIEESRYYLRQKSGVRIKNILYSIFWLLDSFLNSPLSIRRFYQMLRPDESSHAFTLFSFVNLSTCY